MATTKLLLVDDHEVVRSGLQMILSAEEDLRVVGEAASAEESIRKAEGLEPDVVLMDVRMGAVSGIDACRAIKSARPETNVLIFTSFGDEEAVMAAIIAGASGYLLKNVSRAELLSAIRKVAEGQNLLDPAVTRKVMERLSQLAGREQDRVMEQISEREREVLALVAEGRTNREIARQLYITENTARNHVSRILEKLGLTRRSEAAAFAARHGLGPSRESSRG